MHVLGHSFSQKRKGSKRPRDLHIRKVSFSGSSLSGCSLSSDSTTSTASACTAILRPQYAEHAPLRLHERAFKDCSPRSHLEPSASFYDDGAAVGSDYDSDPYEEEDDEHLPHFDMEMPPHADQPESTDYDCHEPTDYFAFQLATRPPMPRSRWSESTIQSVQSVDAIPTPGSTISTAASESEHGEDHGPPVVVEIPPNFSYNRAMSAPGPTSMAPLTSGRRPPLKTMDSISEFVKRGGWKRRGVVFNQEDCDANELSL